VIALLIALACSPLVHALDQINISFTRPQNTPYFVGQPEFNIDAEEFNTVILKIKSAKSGAARLFWATNFDPQMNQPKSIWFFFDQSNDFQEYAFNLRTQSGYWAGYVGQLLVYPENGPAGIEVAPAQAVVGNLGTNIGSGWREFWGPRGRLVIGSTINTIQSTNLFGRPIFSYIYWFLGMIAVGFLGFEIYSSSRSKGSDWRLIWQKTGQAVVLSLLACWVLLEVSSLFTNFLMFKDDLKYLGKDQRSKLTIANTGDFYPFMEFCQANIPPEAKFDFRIPPIYNDIKAIYYLYPRELSTTEADYLVVYDKAVEPELSRKYLPWKAFRAQALIMRAK